MQEEIDPLFHPHTLNAKGAEVVTKIPIAFTKLLAELDDLLPKNCREVQLVRTKLQEACFFANRAAALDPDNQQS